MINFIVSTNVQKYCECRREDGYWLLESFVRFGLCTFRILLIIDDFPYFLQKCELVKTHTARRSGATNMYLAGIPTIAIMKITGHKTEKEFMKYIKITEEQTAMELMNHPYFAGQK